MAAAVEQKPDPEQEAEDAADVVETIVDEEFQKRLWARMIIGMVSTSSQLPGASGRVQFAVDQAYVAACERLTRIFRSDIPDGEPCKSTGM